MIEKLRELTDKGLLTHLSVYAQWGAHKSPTVFHAACVTPHGQGHSDNVDIVAAILGAIENAPKERQRHTPVHVKSSAHSEHIGLNSGHAVSHALAPAPVRGQPVAPAKAKDNNRKTPQGQDNLTRKGQDVVVPNLMELFK